MTFKQKICIVLTRLVTHNYLTLNDEIQVYNKLDIHHLSPTSNDTQDYYIIL